jgi:hypothetical protein
MVFDAFTLLITCPVHEKAILPMNQVDGPSHDGKQTESGEPRQQSEDESDGAEEFGCDHQVGHKCRDPESLIEKSQGRGHSVAAEPTKGFLSAMGEKHTAQYQSQNQAAKIVIR